MKSVLRVASVIAALALAQLSVLAETFEPTHVDGYFVEQFNPGWDQRWSVSRSSKLQRGEEEFKYDGKWAVEEPSVFPGIKGDTGLVLKSKAKQHAISAKFDEPIVSTGNEHLIIQYEVKLQKGLSCGGAYIKLISGENGDFDPDQFSDKTPYSIMFGPDKCGAANNKVHFIFRHQNPVSKKYEEKHMMLPAYPPMSKTTTLYTLIVDRNTSWTIEINEQLRASGDLFNNFEPPFIPPTEIDDPTDVKPQDWVDEAQIVDESATKPDDWDENAPTMIPDPTATKPMDWYEEEKVLIPDPSASKPEEWDDEEDGAWIAPSIPNPKCEDAAGCGPWSAPLVQNPEYKGKWSKPLIPNPAYKGEWSARKIPNPNYFEGGKPNQFLPIVGAGFELWTMDEDILFDNIYIGNSLAEARKLAKETFHVKRPIELDAETRDVDSTEAEAGRSALPNIAHRIARQVRTKTMRFVERIGSEEDKIAVLRGSYDIVGFWAAAVAVALGLLGLIGALLGGKKDVRVKREPASKASPDAATGTPDAAVASGVHTAQATKRNVTAK